MNKSNPTLQQNEPKTPEETLPTHGKVPTALRIFGALSFLAGGATATFLVLVIISLVLLLADGSSLKDYSNVLLVLFSIHVVLTMGLSITFALFGFRLVTNRRKRAALIINIMMALLVGIIICDIMLDGFSSNLLFYAAILVFLIVMETYLDPSLSQERELQRTLRKMETREDVEDGTLGRDESGKGYIALNFFNIFWIFVVCCVLGLVLETIWHFAVVDPGHYQDRAGMIYGPFSPIYGFGAVLMTIALNRFYDKNILIIFLVSALIGGAFEFSVSWFMEIAFGIVAWDYSGTFLSIDGRTNGMFMAMWGLLGVVWIKLCLPRMLKLVNIIPWNWRYTVTAVCAVLMIANGALTILALDCWYQRLAGTEIQDSAIQAFVNDHYNNEFMTERFQSMSINPEDASRSDQE